MNRARIPLADDNKLPLESTAKMLDSCSEVVGLAHDGQDRVAKALLLSPDVIVADLTMPIMTGLEAPLELRKTEPVPRFVFLTVHDECEFVQACIEEGALGCITKSYINADLIPAINAAVTGKIFVSPSLARSEGLL
jgi:DNA-binding NarL/FixJ family response regulator